MQRRALFLPRPVPPRMHARSQQHRRGATLRLHPLAASLLAAATLLPRPLVAASSGEPLGLQRTDAFADGPAPEMKILSEEIRRIDESLSSIVSQPVQGLEPSALPLDEAEAAERRLQGTLPLNTTELVIQPAAGSPISCAPNPDPNVNCDTIYGGLYAGMEISRVVLRMDEPFTATGAALRVVPATIDRAGAQAGDCALGDFIPLATNTWGAPQGASTSLVGPEPAGLQGEDLSFKMGGLFRICYSQGGTFEAGDADIVNPRMTVYGVYDHRVLDNPPPPCAADETCLRLRPYRCYLLRESYNNMNDSLHDYTCIVDYSYPGAGYEPSAGGVDMAGRGTWSKAFSTTYDADGMVDTVTPRGCDNNDAESPPPFLCNTDGSNCADGDPWITPDAAYDYKRINMPAGRNNLMPGGLGLQPYTVAVCYCPGDFGNCDSYSDYIQQIGILHYYVTKVCFHGFDHYSENGDCNPSFVGSTPQHRFSLRIECPSDACSAGPGSRVKIVSQTQNNDLPSWNANSGCGSALAVHGESAAGKDILPDSVNFIKVATTYGMDRQDYKLWNYMNETSASATNVSNATEGGLVYNMETSGFMFQWGPTYSELRNAHNAESFDVCYCDGACNEHANWFKVGQVRFAPFQLVSAAANRSTVQDEFLLEYVNTAGSLGYYRPFIDYNIMGLQEGGMLKLVSDSNLDMDDAACVAAPYDPTYAQWSTGAQSTWTPLDQNFASTTFRGMAPLVQNGDDKLVFNDANVDNVLRVAKAGYIAVCYCSRVSMGICGREHWVLATRMTIRGPAPNQHWQFSTYVTFRFSFTGWGLSSGDFLRVINSEAECSDSDGDPNGHWDVTGMKIQCPHPCESIGSPEAMKNGDISVKALADDAYLCNELNEDCRENDLKSITVIDEHTTELEFEAPPDFVSGDHITLGRPSLAGDNIQCNPDDLASGACTDERLSAVKGRFRLVDQELYNMHSSAPEEYIAGHTITPHPTDNEKVFIPIGWADPKPRFEIVALDAKYGKWTRHNRATTALELMGEKGLSDMKVCWKYAQRGSLIPRYVAQVGTLTLVDPNPLSNAYVSLTSSVKGQRDPYAPIIISFRTASAASGERYHTVEGMTQLKLFFSRVAALEPRFTDGGEITPNPGENDMVEARQYVCGKLFKELWSTDNEFGFPMPRGCYYRIYGQTVEISLLFDRKNGLNSNQDYQMVMSAAAEAEAVLNGAYLHVFTMDDTVTRPYEAIERGVAELRHQPQDGAYGNEGVRWAVPGGFKVVGGNDANVLEFTGGSEFAVELLGDESGGGITANSIIRIYLWPLTMWDVSNRCNVRCEPYDEVDYPCGEVQECKGDAVLGNFQRNFLQVILPATMTQVTLSVVHTLVFTDLVLPQGGFFPTRFAAQVSTYHDDKPHYIESIGDYLYKQPEEGQGVGKLVNFYGDGNHKPFRGDTMNVLYANIKLAATLFAAIQTGDALMTLTLPPGYECLRLTDINGESPWRTPADLGIFGGSIPQGTGLPDEGSGVRGWSVNANTCTYTLRQNAVVYAGSSLYIRVTVNNPPTALRSEMEANRWNLTLRSKGTQQHFEQMPDIVFKTNLADYSANVAVLGFLTQARLIPSPLAMSVSQSEQIPSIGFLRIFFHTEQSTGVNSSLTVSVPADYVFDPCQASNLDDSYYAYTGRSIPTKRLPGIMSCVHSMTPFSHVHVTLSGSMLAATTYAFRLRTKTPLAYNTMHRDGWRLYTQSGAGFDVDGTPNTIPPLAINYSNPTLDTAPQSFGLYQRYVGITVQISGHDMLPYSMSGASVPVTLLLGTGVLNGSSTMRVVAPEGFVWDLVAEDFLCNESISGVTEPLPFPTCLPDVIENNVLMWTSMSSIPFSPVKVYGFRTMIRIPDHSPTASVNEFVADFGHDKATLSGRLASGACPVRPVRALVNAKVDYLTNVESKANKLIFQLQTITQVPPDGRINITGPSGFIVASNCLLESAPPERGSTYETAASASLSLMLPTSIQCSSQVELDGRVKIHLIAPDGLLPGRYRFQIGATNPAATSTPTTDQNSACGVSICWDFASSYLNDHLDAPTAAPSFGIDRLMVGAVIPTLTLPQQQATLRDDRPLLSNPLVFAFRLSSPAPYSETVFLRGPTGFIFREDCLEDVEIRGAYVFGVGQAMPSAYEGIPLGMTKIWCRGEGPNAEFYLHVGGTMGLAADVLYPFRITILTNPGSQPSPNQWTISYNGETSDPFASFDLWTFSRTSILPVSTATSSPVIGAVNLDNPVTLTFRPHNTVMGEGMRIKVTAPLGFTIASTNYICNILIQPISADATGLSLSPGDEAPDPIFDGPVWLLWGEADTECVVDLNMPNAMTATVLASRELTAGRDYQLTVFVNNPTVAIDQGSSFWLLETYQSPGESGSLALFRDLSRIPTYAVNDMARTWMYLNPNYRTGTIAVQGLYFELQFPNKLEIGDLITIEAPAGFSFEAESPSQIAPAGTQCNNFRWEPLADAPLYLPNSNLTCDSRDMVWRVEEPKAMAENTILRWRIDTRNPASTPHTMLNNWICKHISNNTVLGSKAAPSWNIQPQLSEVRVMLVGAENAAESRSSIAVSFRPVSDADELLLTARRPSGFDFTGARATSLGHEVVTTAIEQIRVRAAMYAGITVDILIEDLKLARIGGQTTFDLVTRLNSGLEKDEMLDFTDGFVLPGRLTVLEQTLLSAYNLDPVTYPVSSLWDVRMQEEAVANFRFTSTRLADVGAMIRLRAPPYTFRAAGFVITRLQNMEIVLAEVVSVVDGELVARLDFPLWADEEFSLRVNVLTPNVPQPEASMWSFDLLCPCCDCNLPINTNDGLTEGFRLVDSLSLQMSVQRSPPMAQVRTLMDVDPSSTRPTELRLIAPAGFNFSEDCLASGGLNDEITACVRIPDLDGRAVARLTCQAGGLNGPTQFVQIFVITPPQNVAAPAWYVEARSSTLQLGWAEDPVGIGVQQMVGSNVLYPGIPGMPGLMAFRFITTEKVNEGGMLEIGYPRSFTIQCDGAFLEKVALEGNIDCTNFPRQGFFQLHMPRPLPPGQQAFAVESIAPAAVHEANVFSIKVISPNGQVADAAMNIPGQHIQHGLALTTTPLIWSSAEASRSAQMTMGLELLQELPDLDPPVISEIVVEVPRDFQQQVFRASHFEMSGSNLPVRSPPFLESSNPSRLGILLDERETPTLPIGQYVFTFPVMLPSRMPAYNIWIMTVCGPRTSASNRSCTGSSDPRALVTFPMAGFELGEDHPSALRFYSTSGAQRRFPVDSSLVWGSVLLPFALLFVTPGRVVAGLAR